MLLLHMGESLNRATEAAGSKCTFASLPARLLFGKHKKSKDKLILHKISSTRSLIATFSAIPRSDSRRSQADRTPGMLRKDDVLSGLTGRQLTDLSISYNFPLQSQSRRHCQAHCCLAKNLRAQCASFWSSASQHAHLERKRSSQTTDFWTVKCGLLEDHQEVANPELQNGNSMQGRGQPCSSTKAATPTFSPLGPCTRHGSFTSKSKMTVHVVAVLPVLV